MPIADATPASLFACCKRCLEEHLCYSVKERVWGPFWRRLLSGWASQASLGGGPSFLSFTHCSHYEIYKYYESCSQVHAKPLQNIIVRSSPEQTPSAAAGSMSMAMKQRARTTSRLLHWQTILQIPYMQSRPLTCNFALPEMSKYQVCTRERVMPDNPLDTLQ